MRIPFDRGGMLSVLALGTAGLLLAVTVTQHWSRLREMSQAAVPGPQVRPPPAARPNTDYGALPGWNLLGAAPAIASAPAPQAQAPRPVDPGVDPSRLPRASVNFTLRGVAFSEDAQRTYAIVAGPDGNQKRYAIGDAPQSGVTIERITAHEIVLRHAGRLESLALPHPQQGGAAPGPTVLPMTPPDSMPAEQAMPESPPMPPDVTPMAPPES